MIGVGTSLGASGFIISYRCKRFSHLQRGENDKSGRAEAGPYLNNLSPENIGERTI